MKWQRRYEMQIQGQTQLWLVKYPFTCKFHVEATGTPSPNLGRFFFYNLPKSTRDDIVKDLWDDITYRKITFAAGYESDPYLPVIFAGNVVFAYSYRQGPDWITEIECVDGGWAIANSNIQYVCPAGTTYQQILRQISLSLSVQPGTTGVAAGGALSGQKRTGGLGIGVISNNLDIPTNPSRGEVISGNPWRELISRTLPLGAKLFISQETIYIVAQNEYIANTQGLTELSPDTGVIGSPRRELNMLIVNLLFEPRLQVGQKVTIKTAEAYAGDHEVRVLDHRGTISPVESGEYTTTATFFRFPNAAIVEAA